MSDPDSPTSPTSTQGVTLQDDPPVPPVEPDLSDCCASGCDPCIFDVYTAELHRYRAALLVWTSRQTQQVSDADGPDRTPLQAPDGSSV